jgi:hypothetical protein
MMTVTLTLALATKEMTMEEPGMTLWRIRRRFPGEMPLRYSRPVEEVHVRPNPIPQRLSPRIKHVRSTSRIPERLAGHVQPPTRTCPGL